MEPFVIDLGEFLEPGVGVLAGQDQGRLARDRFRLDEFDARPNEEVPDGCVTIVIPPAVYSFNSSFFLGMLSSSVLTLGETEFRRRYLFTGPDAARTREKGIRVSLLTGSPIRSLRRKTA